MEMYRSMSVLVLLSLCVLASNVEASIIGWVAPHNPKAGTVEGRGLSLVNTPQTVLTYHNGPLMTVGPTIPVYLIWYGRFSAAQRATILAFFDSLSLQAPATPHSVRSWWNLTSGYKDTKGKSVAPAFRVAGEVSFASKSKKPLVEAVIEALVGRSLKRFPANSNAIYVVLTAADVQLPDFCLNSCASHYASNPSQTKQRSLHYIWVGNPGTQCPGFCAWPFAKPQYGPPNFVPLLPPNGDVGIDGMIINLASMVAGAATNPDGNGYYQGDATAPLEAATACTGSYGPGAYPGYPGQLIYDKATKVSFNTYGVNNRKFLVPGLWVPYDSTCTPP
ncbi:unnamed protein product [Calypogeia fissa]